MSGESVKAKCTCMGIDDANCPIHTWNPGSERQQVYRSERQQVYRENRTLEALEEWWLENAKREAEKLGPKAIEYGSYDLELIGDVLHTIIDHSSSRARAKDLESGIVFYLIGKIARLASALRDGHEPSDDTFLDISIYARMALYIREKGQWP